MNDILKRALEIKNEIIDNRRYIHRFPEIGMNLPRTCDYVKTKLIEMGYEPFEICKSGITATVGKSGKTILLRADMDGLPMNEESDLEFKSENSYGHTCGHDNHTAMLLGAAKILKEYENELEGTVKFMFQPGEETLEGAKAMVEGGLLENPHVDAAMAIHIEGASNKVGFISYATNEAYASCDRFTITVIGKGGHGAYPEEAVDPINISVHIHLSLQEIVSREIAPDQPIALTICSIHGGDACNIIPMSIVMEGSLRTYSNEIRTFAKERITQICELTAKKFRGNANVNFELGTGPVIDDENLTYEMLGYAKEIVGDLTGPVKRQMGNKTVTTNLKKTIQKSIEE